MDVRADLRQRGIDTVVDTSGSQGGLDIATDIVRRAGRINLFGWIKDASATFNPSTWHGKAISVVNSLSTAQLRDPFPTFMAGVTSGEVDGYIKGVVQHGGRRWPSA